MHICQQLIFVVVVLLSDKRALTRKQRHQIENTAKIAEAQARKDSVVGVFGVKDAILEIGSQELYNSFNACRVATLRQQ